MPPKELKFLQSTAEQIWSHPTWDLILVLALLAAGFFYGLMAGKRRIAATIMYSYIALAVSSALPLEKWIGAGSEMDSFYVKAGVFLALFFALALVLGSRRGRGLAPASSWWQVFLLSFLQVGFLIHLVLGFLPKDKIALLAPLTKNVFASADLHLWWMVVPLGVLILLKWLERRDE